MDQHVFKKQLFGKNIEITLFDTDKIFAEVILDSAYKEALRLEKIFNLFDKASEICKLNKKRKLDNPSKELVEVLKRSIDISKISKGAYDVSKGKNFSERKKGGKLSILNCSYNNIVMDEKSIFLDNDDVLVDLGSIAKGYIVDKIVDFLKNEGVESGIVEGRGDLRVFGEMEVNVNIQHPRDKENSIGTLLLKDSSVATSGDYNQYSKTFEDTHILNNKDLISVTVIAEELIVADAFSTLLFVSDKKSREETMLNNKHIKAFCVLKNLDKEFYNGFDEMMER